MPMLIPNEMPKDFSKNCPKRTPRTGPKATPIAYTDKWYSSHLVSGKMYLLSTHLIYEVLCDSIFSWFSGFEPKFKPSNSSSMD